MVKSSPETEIRDHLNENFHAYTQNPILNQLTPSRNTSRNRDSNMVASPVRTMRRGYHADEYDTTNENSRHSTLERSTVNVPLNDSSRPMLRKGTPGKVDMANVVKSRVITSSFLSSNLEKAVFGNRDNGRNSHKLAADEFDDDEDDVRSNETLQSDLPNDILSPEKHVYPKENISNISAELSTGTILQKIELYPELAGKMSGSTPQRSANTSTHLHTKNSSSKQPSPLPQPSSISNPRRSKSSDKRLSPPAHISPIPTLKRKSSESLALGLSSPARRLVPSGSKPLPSITSKYQSSDEEPDVPELTVKLTNDEGKRKRTENNTTLESASKRLKTDLYPSLVPNYKLNESSAGDSIASITETSKVRHGTSEKLKPLYPKLPEPTKGSTTLDETTRPNGQSTSTNFNVSNNIHVSKIPQQLKPSLLSQPPTLPAPRVSTNEPVIEREAEVRPERSELRQAQEAIMPLPQSLPSLSQKSPTLPLLPTPRSQELSGPKLQEEVSGDSDHWSKLQWKHFFSLYKAYKSLVNEGQKVNKDKIFTTEALKYLRCNLRDIKLKIQFIESLGKEIMEGKM